MWSDYFYRNEIKYKKIERNFVQKTKTLSDVFATVTRIITHFLNKIFLIIKNLKNVSVKH